MVVRAEEGDHQELESSEEFQRSYDKHSAVESAINALEVHGLDRCPDSPLIFVLRVISLPLLLSDHILLHDKLENSPAGESRSVFCRALFKFSH